MNIDLVLVSEPARRTGDAYLAPTFTGGASGVSWAVSQAIKRPSAPLGPSDPFPCSSGRQLGFE